MQIRYDRYVDSSCGKFTVMEIKHDQLRSVTLVDLVEKKILDYIKKNKLGPGASIPGEVELTDTLQVGRSVIREALSRLRMLGIIESRTRRGMVLSEPAVMENLDKMINPYMLKERSVLDLIEFRISLDIGICDQIFDNITQQDIKDLEKIVKEQPALGGNRYAVESEHAFHRKLYEIPNNEIIKGFQAILLPLFNYVNEHFDEFAPFFAQKKKVISHKDLLNYLKKGDREGYRKAMMQDLKPYAEFVKSKKATPSLP